ncbi:MAG: helix-hairpin-helix domain-containing protein [Bacteroidota bacterium]
MKRIKFHFRFDKQERNGIFFLILCIVLLQSVHFFVKNQNGDVKSQILFDEALQTQIDSLKQLALVNERPKLYPFNPNFITDFKGYTLGMSPQEIDRLFKFRETGKYVNSALEFQRVTHVSDSLLSLISPYFKFPEWTQKKTKTKASYVLSSKKKESSAVYGILDLNKATAEELMKVRGIGQKLSTRIIRFRDRLGGFLVNEQLYDVYGLDAQVVERIHERFQVLSPPEVKKININSASASEIAQLVYIKLAQAEKIVRHREANGPFSSLDEMMDMFNDSEEKINRIGLYLSFEEEQYRQ